MTDPTSVPGMSEWPEPVTLQRIQNLAEAANLSLAATDNDRLRTRVGENVIEVALSTDKNTVIRILGLSSGVVQAERVQDLATFANNWHRERVWPTLIWTGTTEGTVNLRSVYTHDVTAGATDSQLTNAVRIGIAVTAKGLDSLVQALASGTTEPGPA